MYTWKWSVYSSIKLDIHTKFLVHNYHVYDAQDILMFDARDILVFTHVV